MLAGNSPNTGGCEQVSVTWDIAFLWWEEGGGGGGHRNTLTTSSSGGDGPTGPSAAGSPGQCVPRGHTMEWMGLTVWLAIITW